ncbi:MAG: tRNA 2-thiouridine(34) synthase MnmA, partial [Candidatus Cloacimonadota bacterium]|nr:tRNA 2-thiouridine(34) synthase MnmA [Candidatus Cloacimonadota bacterium]
FLSEYENGRTPNPCVLCNPTIKFGELLDKSVDLGAEFMATGHYVQLKEINSLIHIFRPKDKKKDQTYMLWDLSQEQFAKVKFPLADYTKDEIRKITSKFDLQTSIQKDSQEICFIKDSYTEYIRDKIEYKKGDVILENYGKIGEHKGLPFYTIGQRKGLGISWESPIYIKKLDTKKNQIIVTDKKENLTESVFYIKNTNWINEPKNKELEVQIRYNSKPVIVKSITESTDKYKVELHEKAMSITPGQSAVFYSDDELIGGGIIE